MRFLLLALLVGFQGIVRAEDPAPLPAPPVEKFDKSAINFLAFTEMLRDVQEDHGDAQAEYLAAIQHESLKIDVYKMDQGLYSEHAISRDELKESEKDRDTAVAGTRMWRDKVSALQSKADHLRKRIDIAAGAPVDIDGLYNDHLLQWQAECQRIKSAVDYAAAEVALWSYRVQNGRTLRQTNAISAVELLEREYKLKAWTERLKNKQVQDTTCLTGIPDLQFVRGILNS
ncbi:hypothetical protein K2X33_04690 [bacterium]|nr:hypothetical protein [bacterium]